MTGPAFPTYPEQIYYLAQRVQQAVEYGFTASSVPLPDRRLIYCAPNPPVDPDDPDATVPGLLAISLVEILQGKPGRPQVAEQIPPLAQRMATIQIELWRPASGLTQQLQLPGDEDITFDAVTFYSDAAVLWGALEYARANHTIEQATHDPFALLYVRPASVSGDTAGTVARIQVSLTS